MDRVDVLATLRTREADLRAMGIERLSLFGSTARGEAGSLSDVDLAARFNRATPIGLFALGRIISRLEDLLGMKIDLVTDEADGSRFQARLDRDRMHVF